jgi:hypothetical protein
MFSKCRGRALDDPAPPGQMRTPIKGEVYPPAVNRSAPPPVVIILVTSVAREAALKPRASMQRPGDLRQGVAQLSQTELLFECHYVIMAMLMTVLDVHTP